MESNGITCSNQIAEREGKIQMLHHLNRLVPDRFAGDPENSFRVTVFIYLATCSAPIILMGLIGRNVLDPLRPAQWITGLVCVGLIAFSRIIVTRFKLYQTGAAIYLVGLFASIFGIGILNGGVRAPGVAIILSVPLQGVVLFGSRRGLLITLLSVLALLLIDFLDWRGLCQPFQFSRPAIHTQVLSLIYSFLIFFGYIIGSAYENARKFSLRRNLELSRLKELEILTGGVSHEINNPLTIILHGIEVLQAQAQDGTLKVEKIEPLLLKMSGGVDRIVSVINSLKLYSDSEASTSTQKTSVRVLLDDALSLSQELFRAAGIQVACAQEGPELYIDCRRTEILRVLISLLHNSHDALEGQPVKSITLTTREISDGVEIAVADSGPEIPAEARKRIFTPFYTTKAPGRGMGLALSVNFRLMHEHGGRIYLDEKSRATTFVLWFPRSLNSSPHRPRRPVRPDSEIGSPGTGQPSTPP